MWNCLSILLDIYLFFHFIKNKQGIDKKTRDLKKHVFSSKSKINDLPLHKFTKLHKNT